MVATKHGTTTVEIEETYLNKVTTLDETVEVTVTTASIKKELSLNGFTTMVDGDIYGDFPVDCRDHTKTYHYEAENTSICTVTTGGTDADQDYLVISPLKVGVTSISVFETVTGTSTKERVGSFKVTVKKLSVKKAAELNDDFVEGLGVPEIKTVEDLKAYINEGLQQQHDQQYEAQKENTIFDAFMADSEVELDDDAIDEALDRQMSYMANQMMAQGIQLDQYLQMTGMDEEKLREQMKPSATQQAKLEALIDEIIAVENIVVTEEVLDEQLNMVGQANQMTKEQVLEKIDLEGFKRDLSRMQASRIIVNNAVEK